MEPVEVDLGHEWEPYCCTTRSLGGGICGHCVKHKCRKCRTCAAFQKDNDDCGRFNQQDIERGKAECPQRCKLGVPCEAPEGNGREVSALRDPLPTDSSPHGG